MGHALTFTLQDVLIRFNRMQKRDALWQPGMDHAGIATQMVVERQLAAQNVSRRDLGREAFIQKIWEWKAESGGKILISKNISGPVQTGSEAVLRWMRDCQKRFVKFL